MRSSPIGKGESHLFGLLLCRENRFFSAVHPEWVFSLYFLPLGLVVLTCWNVAIAASPGIGEFPLTMESPSSWETDPTAPLVGWSGWSGVQSWSGPG